MAFAAPPGEFGRHYVESHLLQIPKVPESMMYSNRNGRGTINDVPYYPPGGGNPGGEMELTEKMGALELAQQALNSQLPGQRQVKELVHVIEAAESAIRNQMKENEHLRTALRVTEWELQNSRPTAPTSADRRGLAHANGHLSGNKEVHAGLGVREEQQGSIIIHPGQAAQQYADASPNVPAVADGPLGQSKGQSNGMTGAAKGNHRGGHPHLQPFIDTGNASVPSSRSMSPADHGHRRETELEMQHRSDAPHNGYQQQELALRTSRMYEEELGQLRSRLMEASVKESQMLSEKRILERRVAELRLAYDQQQQGLVDAASKALSYRQDVLEENIRLTYALQASDQERSVYVSSLMPLLAEFDLQPTVTDAHSMVSAVKILVQHLRSELNLSEMQGKGNDPQYRPTWQRTDLMYQNNGQYPQQSPPRPKFHGLEIVPQQSYAQPQMPSSPPSPMRPQSSMWDSSGISQYPAMATDHAQYAESETILHPSSPPGNQFPQTAFANDSFEPGEVGNGVPNNNRKDLERFEPPPGVPHLPTLPEEPSSSPSEDGDPLPAINGLQIVGHAVLSGRLTACGHSINGTALCMFQWVRHYQNGTTTYIEGAAQPEYTITADDCDTMIAIECVPMDERNRRGELVTVFANDSRWITCDAMMQDQIDSYSAAGHTSFEVQLLVDGSQEEIFEPVTLTLKRSSYELRRNGGTRRIVAADKFSSDVFIRIPVGHLIQGVITKHEGRQFQLEFRDNRTRDVAVLTFRLFQKMALEGKRGRRRNLPWLR